MIILLAAEKNTHFSIVFGNKKIEKMKIVEKAFQQSELLLQEIDKLIGKKKLTGIMVVSGPGDFSALRIGIATANTLAYGWEIPVIGVKLEKSWLKLEEEEKLLKIWNKGLAEFETVKKDQWVVPEYDKEPNIT